MTYLRLITYIIGNYFYTIGMHMSTGNNELTLLLENLPFHFDQTMSFFHWM